MEGKLIVFSFSFLFALEYMRDEAERLRKYWIYEEKKRWDSGVVAFSKNVECRNFTNTVYLFKF